MLKYRHLEPLDPAVLVAEPEVVGHHLREDLVIGDGVLVTEDEELLAALSELGDVLAKQGERRIGHDHVRLVEQRDALGGAEVAALFEERQGVPVVPEQVLDVGEVDRAIAVRVRDLADHELVRCPPCCPLRDAGEVEERELFSCHRRAGVGSRDEPLQAKVVEVHGEVLEEVRLERVVAVAEDDLPAELVLVVA
jgi:hypothetical protein